MEDYPEIIFKYSSVYDRRNKEAWLKQKKKLKDYPSSRKILNYIKKAEKLWNKEEKRILREISKVTHLKWKEEFIYCYVVGRCRPFSFPLTLPIYENNLNDFVDVLTHELIHRLFTQKRNREKTKKAWNYFNRKYKSESRVTKIHIQVQAIHSHIYLKFFGKRRLKRNIKRISFRSDYKKAWDIVQKEGYQKILKEFSKRID